MTKSIVFYNWMAYNPKIVWFCDLVPVSQPTLTATIYPISSLFLFYLITESFTFTRSILVGLLLYNLWCLGFKVFCYFMKCTENGEYGPVK